MEDDSLGLIAKVTKDWRSSPDILDEHDRRFLEVGFEVSQVAGAVLEMKTGLALESNNPLGKNLNQCGDSKILTEAPKYPRRRRNIMGDRANLAMRYWKL